MTDTSASHIKLKRMSLQALVRYSRSGYPLTRFTLSGLGHYLATPLQPLKASPQVSKAPVARRLAFGVSHLFTSLSMILGMVLSMTSLIGCSTEKSSEVVIEPLSSREQLIRLSMDLRGTHPTEEELVAIEQHPELYDQYVERYLQSQAFLDRMMEVFNQAFLTRTGDTYYKVDESNMGEVDEAALARSIGDEPLRLIRYIVENDLPYSELVQAPYTMSNELLSAWWDIDYPQGATGWQPGVYRDQRPMAGVLSMDTFWHRYPSAGGNANRHRANAISRILLCDDFLSRPIVLNRTAIDQLMQDPEMAIKENPGCQSCHSSLDPLSGNLFGFFREDRDDESLQVGRTYLPENEMAWKDYSGRSPAYFGTPTSGLEELGTAIAHDPRFVSCAVNTVFSGLTQRTPTNEDWTEVEGYRVDFEQSGLNLKALVRDIVRSDNYKAARISGDDALADRVATVKMASPSQLANVIEQSTGYRWTFNGADGLAENVRGLSVLAGGIDSKTVKIPAASPSLGLSLVQERLAQAAGYAVASHDLDPKRTDEARLLTFVTANDRPETNQDAFKAQIETLYRKITGIPLQQGATEPQELMTLWTNVYSVTASPVNAWTAVLAAVLRDPRVVLY